MPKVQVVYLPISKPPAGVDVSIRNALRVMKPNAKQCVDLTNRPMGPKYLIPQASQPVTQSRSKLGSNRILTRKVGTNAALLAAATLSMLSAGQSEHAYTSVYHEPEQKNQRQARASSKAAEWMLA
eukprot:3554802-Rhodomonas_salina.1